MKQPIMADQENPIVSVLIYNYEGKHLEECFESIAGQSTLNNIEIIFIDDSTSDGSWDIGSKFCARYPGVVTLTRNKKCLGPRYNLENALRMARGKYSVCLTSDVLFDPEYAEKCIRKMEADPFTEFAYVLRTEFAHVPSTVDTSEPLPSINKYPLVSVLIFNYNYGCYLRECLDSVVMQNYDNLEICFSDNASSDESWDIALEYARKYPGMMYMTRNRINFGSDANFSNCLFHSHGKYYVELCSDDAFAQGYIERCVSALEANPNAGFALVHRTIIDEEGKKEEEPPFYNQSCVIPGPEQAAVYMMAAVNPSISQVMYRRKVTYGRRGASSLASRWYGTRLQDFRISCEFPIVYIKEPLLLHRVHSRSDSLFASSNLLEIVGPYLLVYQFADIASTFVHSKVTERLPQAVDKLATLSLRYSARALCLGDETNGFKYFHMAAALNVAIVNDEIFFKLQEYWEADAGGKQRIVELLKSSANVIARNVSYDPPVGSVPLACIL